MQVEGVVRADEAKIDDVTRLQEPTAYLPHAVVEADAVSGFQVARSYRLLDIPSLERC